MIELFLESSAWSRRPRVSFSHDFPQTAAADGIPIPHLDSPTDFHFFSADSYSCSADDLFSDGLILPAAAAATLLSPPPHSPSHAPPPIDTSTPQPQQPPLPLPKPSSNQYNSKDETLSEIMKPIPEESSPAKESSSKNFWHFR